MTTVPPNTDPSPILPASNEELWAVVALLGVVLLAALVWVVVGRLGLALAGHSR